MSEEKFVYVDEGATQDDEIQERSKPQNTQRNNVLRDIGSAIGDSTGSTFGGSISPLSKSMRAPGKKIPGTNNDIKPNNGMNFAANKAANMFLNKSGNGGNVPDALKKRNSALPNLGNGTKNNPDDKNENKSKNGIGTGMNSESQKAEANEPSESEQAEKKDQGQSVTKEAAKKVAKKGGSVALQSVGVPKPLADIVANEISIPVVKIILISVICALFGFIVIILAVGISINVYFEPIISGFEKVKESLSTSNIINVGLLDIKLNNNLLILAEEDDPFNILGEDNKNTSGKSKLEIQREQFHKTLEKLASDSRYKNIQWNVALASVLYGVSSDRDIYDGYCEIQLFDTCISADEGDSVDYNEAESNLKKIVKKLKNGKSEYEKYMLETYIPKYFTKKMEREDKTEEDILKEIYKMATIVGDLFPEITGTYISNICPGGINVLAGSDSTRFPAANNLSLEEYVAGSLSSEYSGYDSSESETELMRAMAIAIRSNIVNKVKGKEDSNGVCTVINSTNFQTYREPTERTTAVAQETSGKVLMYNDEVVMAYYSIFPGKDADGFSSSTPCENSVCSGGMCSAMLYKFPNREKAYFSVPQSYRGYSNVGNIDNSHCHGISTIVAGYYASSQSLTHDKILNLFTSDGVTISQLSSGAQSLPLDIADPANWRTTSTSRIYAIGTAGCYRNGVLVGTGCNHLGIDFTYGGINGQPVYAIAPGIVLISSYQSGGYGNYVKLGHDIDGDGAYDYFSIYGHMLKTPLVSQNEVVQAGQQIGQVGSTGNSTGPHLHFEVYSSSGGRTVEDYYNTRPDLMIDRIVEGKVWYEG